MADPSTLARLVGEDVGPFGQLLAQLSSPNPSERLQAEQAFGGLKENYSEGLVVKLVAYVKNGPTSAIRSFAATLLRQVLTKEQPSLWPNISRQIQEAIRRELLTVLADESDRDVSIKIANVVSELFSKIVGNECWPELIPFLCQQILQHSSNQTTRMTEICIYIMAEIAPVLTDSLENPIDQFITMMKPCLCSQDSSIRMASIKAVKCFALALEGLDDVIKLKVQMPDVLNAFSAIRFDTSGATEAYAIMIELAEYVPILFEDVQKEAIAEFLSRAKDPTGDVNSATMALEFILALLQGIHEDKFKDLEQCMSELMALLMDCLLQIEDVPDWYEKCGGDGTSPDFGDLHDLAIESVDRCARSIPGHVFLSLFSVYAQQWARDADWKKRHGVLSVMGQMAEGCSAELTDSVQTLLEICTQGLSDPHVRVRWAACQATGLVADEIGSLISRDDRDQLIGKLICAPIIDDLGALSVQRHALQCLINIINTTEHKFKELYLDEIIKWILQSMHFDHSSVNQAALDCLSCITVASTIPTFAKYYNDCMKAIFEYLNRINNPNDLEEISDTIEIMTRVGAAAGKECFAHEVRFIVDYLKELTKQIANLSDKNEQMTVSINVLNSIARVCLIEGPEFDSLDFFKDLLIQALTTEPKIETVVAEESEDDDEESDPFKIVIAGKCFRVERMSLAFCTCGMKTAMSMARDLKHVFFPALVPVLEAFFPAMDYKVMKDIRHLAIQAQPLLLECATEQHKYHPTENNRSFVVTLLTKQWESFIRKLSDLENEANEISAHVVLETAGRIVEVMQGEIEPEMMIALFEKMNYTLQHFAKLRSERGSVEDGELNDEEIEEFTDEVTREQEYLLSIQRLLTAVLTKTHDRYFNQISPFISRVHEFMSLLKSEQADHESLETILTMLTDICEYSEEGVRQYGADVSTLFHRYLDHPYSGVRHIAAFGVGVLAQRASPVFQSIAAAVAHKLKDVLQLSGSSKDANGSMAAEDGMAVNNAVSALGKILAVHGQLFSEHDRALLYQLWLSYLPLKYDHAEAQLVHSQLIHAVCNMDQEILGRNKENVVKVVEILMEIVASDEPLATEQDLLQIPSLLKNLEHESGCGQLAMQKMQKWTEEEKARFMNIMNTTQQQ